MDFVMPGKNGFEATRELARDSATPDIPVLSHLDFLDIEATE